MLQVSDCNCDKCLLYTFVTTIILNKFVIVILLSTHKSMCDNFTIVLVLLKHRKLEDKGLLLILFS
jgi:hypothetical protein